MPKGRTKRLTFTEGRLRLTTSNASICIPWNALPDLKVRRLGRPCGGPMVLALILWSFPIKRKGRKKGIDVGLELLASLILLCLSIARASSTLRSACAKLVLSYQEERTKNPFIPHFSPFNPLSVCLKFFFKISSVFPRAYQLIPYLCTLKKCRETRPENKNIIK